jgi:nucleotide-binding universal stress UspA family protein
MPRDFKQILCPIDFSENSFRALEYAARFATLSQGTLFLVHIVDNPLADFYDPGRATFRAELDHAMQKAEGMLKEAADQFAPGLTHHLIVKHGDPYSQIIDLAASQKVDLIVMSTHGRTGPKRLLIGSVAEKIVRTAPCPVFTVRHTVS